MFTFVCIFFLRSFEGTSSCESGRSTVVTLRCNPDMSTKGVLAVPRYNFSLLLHFMQARSTNNTFDLLSLLLRLRMLVCYCCWRSNKICFWSF